MSGSGGGTAARFRIVAGAAYSWDTALVEREDGARFVYRLADGGLDPVTREEADRLVATRAYRPWYGSAAWSTLGHLPIVDVGRSTPSDTGT